LIVLDFVLDFDFVEPMIESGDLTSRDVVKIVVVFVVELHGL
jgi:hypothetical protein